MRVSSWKNVHHHASVIWMRIIAGAAVSVRTNFERTAYDDIVCMPLFQRNLFPEAEIKPPLFIFSVNSILAE